LGKGFDIWLCGVVGKPILKLTHSDYIENSLGELLEAKGPYDKINIDVFNDLQHTITGWPGGQTDEGAAHRNHVVVGVRREDQHLFGKGLRRNGPRRGVNWVSRIVSMR